MIQDLTANTLNKSHKSEDYTTTSLISSDNKPRANFDLQDPIINGPHPTSSQPLRRLIFQIFIFSLTFLNYAIMHASRAAWSNAVPQIQQVYKFDGKLISWMNSSFLVCYASFGIVSGHLADKYPKHLFLFVVFSLVGTIVISMASQQFIPASNQQIWLYFVLRMLDGTVQSVGWATNLAILSNWFPKKGRGMLIGFWASNANTGDIIGAQIYKATTTSADKWGNGLLIIGAITIVMGIINLIFLVEYPATKGIVIEEDSAIFQLRAEQNCKDELLVQETTKLHSQTNITFLQALLVPGVLLFSLSFFFIKFSMYGFYYWLPAYLQQALGYSQDTSADIFSLFGVGSICGNILLGVSTDLLPMRTPVFILGILSGTLITLTLTLWDTQGTGWLSALIFLLGAALSGSTIVIAAIECDLGKEQDIRQNQRALATVSGIIDGIAGFGSIMGQILIGIVKDAAGWRPTFLMLTIATGLSAIPALFFLHKEIKDYRQKTNKIKQQNFSETAA